MTEGLFLAVKCCGDVIGFFLTDESKNHVDKTKECAGMLAHGCNERIAYHSIMSSEQQCIAVDEKKSFALRFFGGH